MKSFIKVFIDNLKFTFGFCSFLAVVLIVIHAIMWLLSLVLPLIGNDTVYTLVVVIPVTIIVSTIAVSIFQWSLLGNKK